METDTIDVYPEERIIENSAVVFPNENVTENASTIYPELKATDNSSTVCPKVKESENISTLYPEVKSTENANTVYPKPKITQSTPIAFPGKVEIAENMEDNDQHLSTIVDTMAEIDVTENPIAEFKDENEMLDVTVEQLQEKLQNSPRLFRVKR